MQEENKGLSKAKKIYQDRTSKVKDLKGKGKRTVGYVCIYPPTEIMTALDIVPYRILGDMSEPITEADSYLPTVSCPFIRSYFDLGLKGKYDFLDGAVFAHVCDVGEKLPRIWRTRMHLPFYHFLEVPHTTHKASEESFKREIINFKNSLGSFVGKDISSDDLKKSIEVHNRQRNLVRKLYELRKGDPPLLSGVETLQVLIALMSIPVAEGNSLLEEVLAEVQKRKNGPQKRLARLLIWGSIIDNLAFIEMIENLGANLVMDDICIGSRAYWDEVKLTPDPFDGLAHHYLAHLKCPRTFIERPTGALKKDYMSELEGRFGYLAEYVKGWKVNGAILQTVKYCDTHGYEVPSVRDYFDHLGLPHTYLEHDYSEGSLAPLRTRVQAFLEVIT